MIQLKDNVHGNGSHFTYNSFCYNITSNVSSYNFNGYLRQPPNLQVYTFAKYAVFEDSAMQGLNRNYDVNILINQRFDSMH